MLDFYLEEILLASQEMIKFHADTNLLGAPFGSILDSPSAVELTYANKKQLRQLGHKHPSQLPAIRAPAKGAAEAKKPGQRLLI